MSYQLTPKHSADNLTGFFSLIQKYNPKTQTKTLWRRYPPKGSFRLKTWQSIPDLTCRPCTQTLFLQKQGHGQKGEREEIHTQYYPPNTLTGQLLSYEQASKSTSSYCYKKSLFSVGPKLQTSGAPFIPAWHVIFSLLCPIVCTIQTHLLITATTLSISPL